MGFWKRLFSADYRAAVAAEAAGDLELAAERYALAGQPEAAVRVHMARADRSPSRKGEITALRDAYHWSDEDSEMRVRVAARLGRALVAQMKAEGIATERDRERVREAAVMLIAGNDHMAAGNAYESIGDDVGAARAYRAGGHVDQLEDALHREHSRSEDDREEKDAYADYEVATRGGDRDAALRALRRCIDAAAHKNEYRRLYDELESKLITSGNITLLLPKQARVTATTANRILLGRDALCDFVLRSGGISRQHAEIAIEGEGEETRFILSDAGSKNGTRMGGIRIEGSLPLENIGTFDLGDHCTVTFNVTAGEKPRLTLTIESGLDRGTALRAGGSGSLVALADLGLPGTIYFRESRPMLQHPGGVVRLGDERIAHGDIQLVHGDHLIVDSVEVEVQ